jgi:hypothetical protein
MFKYQDYRTVRLPCEKRYPNRNDPYEYSIVAFGRRSEVRHNRRVRLCSLVSIDVEVKRYHILNYLSIREKETQGPQLRRCDKIRLVLLNIIFITTTIQSPDLLFNLK